MTPPSYADFKYKHNGLAASGVLLLVALVVAGLFLLWMYRSYRDDGLIMGGIIVVLVSFFAWPKRRIRLGARWLLCGDRIVYYGNVSRMELKPGRTLALYSGKKQFVLERDRFPTNAKKSHKIAANKDKKFAKVSGMIIRHVLNASPKVELKGIDRGAHAHPAE